MSTNKENNKITYFKLIETKKIGLKEDKRVVYGTSGKNVDIEFIGGIWKEKNLKIPCPECNSLNTFIEFSIENLGWDIIPNITKSEGNINVSLGVFDINCNDCKKVFIYSPAGNINLVFLDELPYPEKKHDKDLH